MNERKLINLQSITYATKARNLLMKYGINSDIVKSPKIAGKSSCGYSLAVSAEFKNVVEILSSNGFKILGVEESDIF